MTTTDDSIVTWSRAAYLDGGLVGAADLACDETYHVETLRWLNRTLHGAGIAFGLSVRTVADGTALEVAPGMALDRAGREIVLLEAARLDLGAFDAETGYVTLAYEEESFDLYGDARVTCARRVRERARLVVASPPPEAEDDVLLLAVVSFVAGRVTAIEQVDATDDGLRRRLVGLRAGCLSFVHAGAPISTSALKIGDDRSREPSVTPEGVDVASISMSGSALAIHALCTDLLGDAALDGRLAVGLPSPGALVDVRQSASSQASAVARFVSDTGECLLVVAGGGDVGVAPAAPAARLHVARGDLHVDGHGGPSRISFGGGLTISGAGNDDSNAIRFRAGAPGATSLEIRALGDIQLVAGGAEQPTLTVTETGRVGVGTTVPTSTLTVAAEILLRDGVVFPDRTVQTEGVVPIPIGAIVDWTAPVVPEGYQACDGSKVEDPASPLLGVVLPDLRGLFVRGVVHASDVGVRGGSTTHTHRVVGSPHQHSVAHVHRVKGTAVPSVQTGGASRPGGAVSAAGHHHDIDAFTGGPDPPTTGPSQSDAPTETSPGVSIPPYVCLLKIMRIK